MAPLQITKKLHISPLIDIQSPPFAQRYVSGVHWRLFGWRRHGEIEAQGPLPEHYLITNLKMCAQLNRFDGCHDEQLREDIGFFLGMLHGGVLTPDGTLRPDAKTLVILHTQDFREGYERGRRDYFTRSEELVHTEDELLDLFKARLRTTSTSAESKKRCAGPLAVPLGNFPGDSSRSPNRNSRTSIPWRRPSR